MSQTYTAQKLHSSDKEREIQVCSKRCRYLVWINDEDISLFGPGVREKAETFEQQFESSEDLAIYTVLLFENGLWPED
jgi:hypothetical protein